MDSSNAKTIGAILLIGSLVLTAVGASDWLACIHAEQALVERGEIEVPETVSVDSYPSRAQFVAPTCSESAPLGAGLNWYLMAVVAFLASIASFMLGRGTTQTKTPAKIGNTPRRERKSTQNTAAIEVAKPIEITLDAISETDRERDSQTLMAFVEEKRAEASEPDLDESSKPRVDGFYVPPGYDDKPILYVDIAATKDDPDNGHFKHLTSALSRAQTMVLGGKKGVQIRVSPGVYQTSIEIPPNVVVINQRLPDTGDAKMRLRWLLAQELDNPDRVTIVGEPDSPFAVRLGPGTRHGIFGCYIVGRNSTKQTGILIERAETAAVVHCVVENFSNSGLKLTRVGSELPGFGATIVGSMFRTNTAQLGGGIFSEESALTIDACVFEDNRARNGGGVFAVRCRHAATIRATRFQMNRAQLPENPSRDPMKLPLEQWGRHVGLGGAIYISASNAKLVDIECISNGASIAGGGAAFMGSKVLIQNDSHTSRFRENRARIGGGMVSIGWPGNAGTAKLQSSQFTQNEAQASGGGIAVVGHNTVQLIDCEISSNSTSGPVSVGGGVSCHIGGALDAQACNISENKSKMHGGGVSSVNGRLRIGGRTEVHTNRAGGSGGGVFAITEPCAVTEELIAHEHFEIPVHCGIDDATIRYNKCGQTGAGIRIGNLIKQPSLPFAIKVNRSSIRSNASNQQGPEVLVTWAGEVVADDVEDLKKVLLK